MGDELKHIHQGLQSWLDSLITAVKSSPNKLKLYHHISFTSHATSQGLGALWLEALTLLPTSKWNQFWRQTKPCSGHHTTGLTASSWAMMQVSHAMFASLHCQPGHNVYTYFFSSILFFLPQYVHCDAVLVLYKYLHTCACANFIRINCTWKSWDFKRLYSIISTTHIKSRQIEHYVLPYLDLMHLCDSLMHSWGSF